MSAEQPRKVRPKVVGTDGTVFHCPICQTVLASAQVAAFPFCSERCRMIDLGNWLDGKYVVSRPLQATGEDTEASAHGMEDPQPHTPESNN